MPLGGAHARTSHRHFRDRPAHPLERLFFASHKWSEQASQSTRRRCPSARMLVSQETRRLGARLSKRLGKSVFVLQSDGALEQAIAPPNAQQSKTWPLAQSDLDSAADERAEN